MSTSSHHDCSDASKIIVGQFASVYGVRGWIRVNSFTDPFTSILNYLPWLIEQKVQRLKTKHQDLWQKIPISDHKIHANTILVKLVGCDNREEARYYTGCLIAVDRQLLPSLPQDEYYWADLIGLEVINQQNQKLGVVDYLFEAGANDVLVLKGERERMLPYTDEVIKNVDLKRGLILVDWDFEF